MEVTATSMCGTRHFLQSVVYLARWSITNLRPQRPQLLQMFSTGFGSGADFGPIFGFLLLLLGVFLTLVMRGPSRVHPSRAVAC